MIRRTFLSLALVGLAVMAPVAVSESPDRIAGPVSARVERIIDGDSIAVTARIWLGQTVETQVRVAGVDTPELRGACEAERQKAQAARALVEERLMPNRMVELREVAYDKYGRRVVAQVWVGGQDLGQILIQRGLAFPYDGGTKRSWC